MGDLSAWQCSVCGRFFVIPSLARDHETKHLGRPAGNTPTHRVSAGGPQQQTAGGLTGSQGTPKASSIPA